MKMDHRIEHGHAASDSANAVGDNNEMVGQHEKRVPPIPQIHMKFDPETMRFTQTTKFRENVDDPDYHEMTKETETSGMAEQDDETEDESQDTATSACFNSGQSKARCSCSEKMVTCALGAALTIWGMNGMNDEGHTVQEQSVTELDEELSAEVDLVVGMKKRSLAGQLKTINLTKEFVTEWLKGIILAEEAKGNSTQLNSTLRSSSFSQQRGH